MSADPSTGVGTRKCRNLGYQPFGELIRSEGRSGAWVCRQIGVSYSHFTTVELGIVAPSPELKERLSTFLGRSAGELFTPAALAATYVRKRNAHVVSEAGRAS